MFKRFGMSVVDLQKADFGRPAFFPTSFHSRVMGSRFEVPLSMAPAAKETTSAPGCLPAPAMQSVSHSFVIRA
jgi:hypothetical protein